MTTQRLFKNPQFLTYTHLLRQLHQLIREGADETVEGEALRNRMDEPAEFLTHEEVDCLNAISADFYTLTGPPSHVQHNPPSALRDDQLGALDARDARDFTKALDLVRKIEPYFDPAYVAYLRGSIWAKAGENEIAVDFFQRAKELAPQNAGYAYMWLDALSRADAGEALATAERLLRQATDHPPQLILKAAEVVFLSRRGLPGTEAAEVSRQLIPVLEDVVVWLETSGETMVNPSLLVGPIGMLGICHMDIGEFDEGRQWFDKGLQLFPNNVALLIARGSHLYGIDPERSRQDFQQAIRLQPRLEWPYYFLAHYYLVRYQNGECLEMAQRALGLATSNALRADCLE
jgi:tetratricopeptide (TPR) repeat protein